MTVPGGGSRGGWIVGPEVSLSALSLPSMTCGALVRFQTRLPFLPGSLPSVTYGYNIMRNLGNKLTLDSLSRGFSMELGSAITIIVATRLKRPVSTTQCITGAIVGVGLCNGTWRTLNWRMIAWIYTGKTITLPAAGLISSLPMGIILNAPRW
ncbi:hypothetical protein RRF57_011721 [Xylaria bambusicola]|uniref:Phosphate transporter n=1 Tax=Xylaria bambusicola TaxID=326684 RepID=A0AAN7UX44_9PEZI